MPIIKNQNQNIAHVLYRFSCGLYVAVASIFGILYLMQHIVKAPHLLAIFLAYFVTILWRSFYDQLVVYQVPTKSINSKNNVILALVCAAISVGLYSLLKPYLGDWSILVTVIMLMKIMSILRALLWRQITSQHAERYQIFSKILKLYLCGLYGFFELVAFITYGLVQYGGIHWFYGAFGLAVFIGLIAEAWYDVLVVYKSKMNAIKAMMSIVLALLFASLSVGFVFLLIQWGVSGKAATISGIIVLKLIQPLIFNRFVISR